MSRDRIVRDEYIDQFKSSSYEESSFQSVEGKIGLSKGQIIDDTIILNPTGISETSYRDIDEPIDESWKLRD